MKRGTASGADVTSGPLLKQMLLFSMPILAMTCLQLLFNAADMVVVGRFSGKEALAAVGATGALINLLVGAFMGLSAGTSVVVAQNYGAKDWDGVSRGVHTSILLSIIGGVVVTAIGIVFCAPLLRWMGTPDNIIDLSILYMKIYFIGVPANMVYNFAAAALRAMGDSNRPMYYLVISGVVNAALNLMFVIVFHRSVDGVAWATVISQYLAMGMILRCLCKQEGPAKLSFRKLCIDRSKLRSVLRIGLPAGAQSVLFSISNVLIQSAVNSFGSDFVAGRSAYGNIEGFVGTIAGAYYNTAITFTGQCMGAKKYDRIDQVAKTGAVLVVATTAIASGLCVLFGRELLGIYSDDANVIEYGMIHMRVMMSTYILCTLMNSCPGLTRGMGYSLLPMICTMVGACALRIVWLQTVFARFRTMGVLIACYPVTWGITSLGQILIFFYARKKIRRESPLLYG